MRPRLVFSSILGDSGHGNCIMYVLGDFGHGDHVPSVLGDFGHYNRVPSIFFILVIPVITIVSYPFL